MHHISDTLSFDNENFFSVSFEKNNKQTRQRMGNKTLNLSMILFSHS